MVMPAPPERVLATEADGGAFTAGEALGALAHPRTVSANAADATYAPGLTNNPLFCILAACVD
jgi:hypothetical protein